MDYLDNSVLGVTNVREVLLILHLIGLAIGAGAAYFSEALFSHSLKDKVISETEYYIIKLASAVVWVGLSIMFVTGLLIFLGDSERLLDSSKFLAKMTILVILIFNGVVFHVKQIPALKKYIGKNLAKSKGFKKELSTPFFIGGAVSGVSWTAAIVLGALPGIDLTYLEIMQLYIAVALIASVGALGLRLIILRP